MDVDSEPAWVRLAVVCVALMCICGPAGVQLAHGQPVDTLAVTEVVDRVVSENYQARIADNRRAIAQNDRSVGNAGFLPTLSVTGGYNETISNTTQQFIGQPQQEIDGAKTTRSNAGAELRWTVFEGGRRFAAYDRLGAELDIARAAAREQTDLVLANALDAYYRIAREQEQMRVFREAVAVSRERLAIAQFRNEVGSASDLEVRQARVDLNADSASVLRQKAAVVQAKAALNRLLARPDRGTAYTVPTQIAVDTTLQLPALEEAALAGNPVLQQARQERRAARATEREVRGDYFPTVDATVGYGWSQVDSESGFLQQSTSTDWTYGLSLTFDVFDGLNRERRRQNATIRTENARLLIDDVAAELRTTLSATHAAYRNRVQLVQLEQENLAAAEANVAVALEQFRLGTITSVELREVQEQQTQAQSRLLDARYEARQAQTELLRLSGGIRDGGV